VSGTLNQPVTKPTHVPDDAVFDFDMYHDPGLNADPHRRMDELVRELPDVFWSPRNDGHWVLMSHAAVFEAMRDWEAFPSGFPPGMLERVASMLPPDIPRIPEPLPITLNPPLHTAFRQPLQSAFTPSMAIKLKNTIRELADRLIDAVIDEGGCDFVGAIAEPLPVTVFLNMMGLPPEKLGVFREIVREFLAPHSAADPFTEARRMWKVIDAIKDVIVARRDDPRDDIISLLWAAKIDGEPMTQAMMEDYCLLLFIAGLDTVVNGLSFLALHLAKETELQAELRAKPELIVDAVEEMLRRFSFVMLPRFVAKDIEICGRTLKAGDKALMCLPAANRDHRRFPDPFRFDLAREDKAHIGFGAGPHRCLGSHLARVEMQVVFEQLLSRLPPFRLDPARPARFHSGNIIAVDSLPLVWGG
jgi:cytochrome P450